MNISSRIMVAKHVCDRDRGRRYLAGRLSRIEQEQFIGHLDHCTACQQWLEQDTTDPRQWQQARRWLTPPVDCGSADAQSRTSATSTDISSALLGYLQPSDEPHILGMLDDYRIEAVIGQGGMGTVLRAQDRSLLRPVAIKLLHPHLANSGAARRRFGREAQAAAAVLHNNVVPIYCVRADGPLPYLVMPLIEGESLQERIDHGGPLECEELLRIGLQIAEGVAAAHSHGLIHRDIKPANILLDHAGPRVLITDFGLARTLDDAAMTASGMLAGTPEYMSPEQASGEPVDPRSDLFSLGVVLYAMATGRSPFRAESSLLALRKVREARPARLSEVNESVPAWLEHLVHRFLAPRASQRPQSAQEAADWLRRCLAHVKQPSRNRLPSQLSRKPWTGWATWGLAALFLIAIGFWGGGAMFGHRDSPQANQVKHSTKVFPSPSITSLDTLANADLGDSRTSPAQTVAVQTGDAAVPSSGPSNSGGQSGTRATDWDDYLTEPLQMLSRRLDKLEQSPGF